MFPFPSDGDATKLLPLQTSAVWFVIVGLGSTWTVIVNGDPAQPPAMPLTDATVYTIVCCVLVVFESVWDITVWPIFCACWPVNELLSVVIVQV